MNLVIDLFASRLNYKVKPFIAYQPDPETKAVNAFTFSWKPYLFYVFPPFSIILLVLQKVREEESTRLVVVPKWPAQPWWPYLMRMVIEDPVILLNKENTVYIPSKPDLIHPLYLKLTLLMCHISKQRTFGKGFICYLAPMEEKYTKTIYPIPQQVGLALPFKIIGSPFSNCRKSEFFSYTLQ